MKGGPASGVCDPHAEVPRYDGWLVGESEIEVTLLRFRESEEEVEGDWAEQYARHFPEAHESIIKDCRRPVIVIVRKAREEDDRC